MLPLFSYKNYSFFCSEDARGEGNLRPPPRIRLRLAGYEKVKIAKITLRGLLSANGALAKKWYL